MGMRVTVLTLKVDDQWDGQWVDKARVDRKVDVCFAVGQDVVCLYSQTQR